MFSLSGQKTSEYLSKEHLETRKESHCECDLNAGPETDSRKFVFSFR